MSNLERTLKERCVLFAAWIALSSALLIQPLRRLLYVSASSEDASYLIFIPFITGCLLFIERHKIFPRISYDKTLGITLLIGAVCIELLSTLVCSPPFVALRLSGQILVLVILWTAGFAFLFGRVASKAGMFPFSFLVLMVPFPRPFLDRIIYVLQIGSTWTTGTLFDLLGVPALREGFVFHLTSVNIEVAKECSGIRSSMVLLILALLVAHFELKKFWSKALFVICGLLMMVLKNGIRIATLTLLAMYVDPSFLFGRLHHQGGVLFFFLGLLLLLPVLVLLKRAESRWRAEQGRQVSRDVTS